MSVTAESVIHALRRYKNVLIYGPPGTGKTQLMTEVAARFSVDKPLDAQPEVVIDTADERTPLKLNSANGVVHRWVTFHQGYSYEDFILGLRPEVAPGGGFSLKPKPGVLLELATEARVDAGLLLIDEINRGNASRIFGEFITLMEPEKRLADDGRPRASTVTVTLPYLGPDDSITVSTRAGKVAITRDFLMPSRVYILASMNSVDKSIAPIDTAIRRRFHVISLFPTMYDLRIAGGLSVQDSGALKPRGETLEVDDVRRIAVAALEKTNRAIAIYLGPDFVLGQWYLKSISQVGQTEIHELVHRIWLNSVLPQLIELFHGRPDVLAGLLDCGGLNGSGVEFVEPSASELDSGGAAYLVTTDQSLPTVKVLEYLQRYVGAPLPGAQMPSTPD